MNTKSALNKSCTENRFWYKKFDLRQIRVPKGDHPIGEIDAADNCPLYVTAKKTMDF